MAFTLIKGTFHIVGYSPDGDSIRFQADDSNNWNLLDGPPVELNARGHAQLRIEAIDTLETHYQGHHQPLQFAKAALDALLRDLGIKQVKFDAGGTVVKSAQDGTRGYILARKTEQNHRPVSFVFTGAADEPDGSQVFFGPNRLVDSVNFSQLKAGLAYPTYYTGLFPDLRNRLTTEARKAGAAKKGLWAKDKTITGFEVTSLKSVTDTAVILPKLFRRIVSFMGNGGSIVGFKTFLARHPDPVTSLKDGHFTHLDTFIEVTGNRVRMTVDPENLVFSE